MDTTVIEPTTAPGDFSSFDFSKSLQATLTQQGFATPTAVQRDAIAPAIEGRDILASAQTGSGKTAAFVLPLLHRLMGNESGRPTRRPQPHKPRALILAPTRELAGQIAEVIGTFAKGSRVSYAVIFGGVNKKPQISAMRRGVDIVVATPGRLLDLMNERVIELDKVESIVLDEADRMLDMGFIPDVRRIIKALPAERQSMFFSATLPSEVKTLSQEMLTNPVRVSVEREAVDTPKIDQHVLFVTRDQKREALHMLLTDQRSYRALVFTRTKHKAKDIARYLNKQGITADDLHGNKSQNARQRALKAFHTGKVHVLVATDIASRGIDVVDIDQVINYELPNEAESYVHRIGRTARAGRSGAAFSLCDNTELGNLKDIQREIAHLIPVLDDHPFHDSGIASDAARSGRTGGGNGGGRSNGPGRSGSSGYSGGRSTGGRANTHDRDGSVGDGRGRSNNGGYQGSNGRPGANRSGSGRPNGGRPGAPRAARPNRGGDHR
ncbi:MAG: DEAD/DEAH box helicase [Alkalispirochaeta sp.]